MENKFKQMGEKYGHLFAEIGWGPEVGGLTPEKAKEQHISPPLLADVNHLPSSTCHFECWVIAEPMSLSSMKPKGNSPHNVMTVDGIKGLSYGRRPAGIFAPDDQTSMLDGSPHYHTHDELYLFYSTSPYTNELGGEVEIWLGLYEQAEKFVITKPTYLRIPAGLVHGPTCFKRVDSPINFVICYTAPYLDNQHVRMLPPAYVKEMEESSK